MAQRVLVGMSPFPPWFWGVRYEKDQVKALGKATVARCDARSGFCSCFDVYAGKRPGEQVIVGIGASVVLHMCKD